LRWVLLCLHCVDISSLTPLQLIVVYFCFTETRGATLEEISQLFDGRDAAEALKVAAAERSEKAMATQAEVTQGDTNDLTTA
jgi:predicted MarR family transcription regulator